MANLAEDNWNDVMINTFSIISSIVAHFHKELWWFDPAGAMAISSPIMYNWVHVGLEHACKIVGLRCARTRRRRRPTRHALPAFLGLQICP